MRSTVLLLLTIGASFVACDKQSADSDERSSKAAPPTSSAPANADTSSDIPEPPARPEPGDLVVLTEPTPVFTEPSMHTTKFGVPVGEGASGRLAEVVALAGDFIELRTFTGSYGRSCVPLFGSEEQYELHFLVLRKDLGLVLTAPVSSELAKGGAVELAEGVQILETDTGERVAAVAGLTFKVPIPDEAVGRWFSASLVSEPQPEQPEAEVDHSNHFHHEGMAVWLGEAPGRAVARAEADAGDLVTFEGACGRVVLKEVEGGEPQPEAQSGPLAVPCDPCWDVEAGTELSWRSGGKAGVVRVDHELAASAVERGPRVCFVAGGFDLCVETTQLTKREKEPTIGDEAGTKG